jgi:hypothetical protein
VQRECLAQRGGRVYLRTRHRMHLGRLRRRTTRAHPQDRTALRPAPTAHRPGCLVPAFDNCVRDLPHMEDPLLGAVGARCPHGSRHLLDTGAVQRRTLPSPKTTSHSSIPAPAATVAPSVLSGPIPTVEAAASTETTEQPAPVTVTPAPPAQPTAPAIQPPPPPPAEPAPAAPVAEVVYRTKTGSKYHAYGCRYLSKSCIECTLAQAKSRGLTPCSVCNP